MDELLLSVASKFGPVALVAVILGQMAFKAVASRFAAKPADPASPIPAPTAESKHPVLDAVLKSMFGKGAPAARDANPKLIEKIREEVHDVLYAPK